MRIDKSRSLLAVNRYAARPVMLLWLDVPLRERQRKDWRSISLPTWLDKLSQASPVLTQKSIVSTDCAAASLVVALVHEMLNTVAQPPTWYPPLDSCTENQVLLALECCHPDVVLGAVTAACARVDEALNPAADGEAERFEFEAFAARFAEFAEQHLGSVHTRYLVERAAHYGFPVDAVGGGRVVIGQGRFQRSLVNQKTDRLTVLAQGLSSDKAATNALLREYALPVARQYVVESAEQAVQAARHIGFPVVVKPLATDMGVGVHVHLKDPAAVERAARDAAQYTAGLLVEEYIEGHDYRLLVVDGNMVAAARRDPPSLVGDGQHTVTELIAQVNTDPRRRGGHAASLSPVEWNTETERFVGAQGCGPESVIPAGSVLALSRVSNLSRGGNSVDVTDDVHPDNRAAAEQAARALAIDLAGVDFMSRDISVSWREQRGAILELNVAPGLRAHFAPAVGTPRNIALPILQMLYPDNAPARIPIAAITGSNGKTTTARMVSRILTRAGHVVGRVESHGLYVAEQQLEAGDFSGGEPAARLLRNPRVDAAVLEIARGALLKFGTGFDYCDVAAVLNVEDEHLGDWGIESIEQMAQLKGLLVELATKVVVLNADDEQCRSMINRVRAAEIVLYSTAGNGEVIARHRAEGGRAVCLMGDERGEYIACFSHGEQTRLIFIEEIPATWHGRARQNVSNALAAAAIALSLDIDPYCVRQALQEFRGSRTDNPGRLNLLHQFANPILVDACHNRHGMEALGPFLETWESGRHKTLVLSAVGDRRAQDYFNLGRAAGAYFDRIVLFAPAANYQRSTAVQAMLAALASGAESAGKGTLQLARCEDAGSALIHALYCTSSGDPIMLAPAKFFSGGEVENLIVEAYAAAGREAFATEPAK